MPIRAKNKLGMDQESSPSQMFSRLGYKMAKKRFGRRPSTDQMRRWLNEDVQRIVKASKGYLRIDEITQNPIYVISPLYFENIEGIDNRLVLRRDLGHSYFYSTYKITVFQFTSMFLAVYQANYNMIKNVTTSDQTDEFFYKDIVSMRTQTKASNFHLKSGEKLEQSKTCTLVASNGDAVSFIINDPKIKLESEIESLGDKAINNIKAMLRQYKQV